MEIPKNLKELVNGTSNSIKFDTIDSLLKVIGINRKHLEALKYHKIIKKSESLLKELNDSQSLTISSNNGLTELKMVKYKGKIYYKNLNWEDDQI